MFFSDPVNKYRKPQFADPGYGRGANSGFYKEIKKDPTIKLPNYFGSGGFKKGLK